jgi:tRNA1(Val) A37 N6-methylase TrmN6
VSLEVTRDRFLGGRVIADQPKHGFRAGHDTVLLAAAVPAGAGDQVLELGSGAGIASLCLAHRVPGVTVLGLEIDAELVRIANANAGLNSMSHRARFETADIVTFRHTQIFHHVFFNPPFHPDTGQASPEPSRDRAKRDADDAITRWTRVALALTKEGGTVTAILRADRVGEMLMEAAGARVIVLPLIPKPGLMPKRSIVRIVKGQHGGLVHAPGLTLHEVDGRNTEAAEAVLRHGQALPFA